RASNSGAGRGVAGLEGGLGMILANVRGRLRVQDFLLVALALAHGDTARRARYERQLLEEGPDELLDEPGLLAALLALRTLMVPSPALFTYVAVRHTLRAAGVDDRACPPGPAHAHGPVAGAVHLRGGAPHVARRRGRRPSAGRLPGRPAARVRRSRPARPHPPQRRRDLPLSGRHGGGPHGARRRRGT